VPEEARWYVEVPNHGLVTVNQASTAARAACAAVSYRDGITGKPQVETEDVAVLDWDNKCAGLFCVTYKRRGRRKHPKYSAKRTGDDLE
jgi:hypothetical protein